MLNFYQGKRVLITGNTGFKGAWLSAWLCSLGAYVYGLSLEERPSQPNMYDLLNLQDHLVQGSGDIRDVSTVRDFVRKCQPDLVIHLAAQPLVREGYRQSLMTVETNVMGTAYLLEAIKEVSSVQAVIVITSDKCYANEEDTSPHTETDPLGGRDPYSASKAAAELIVSAYTQSFLQEQGIGVATVRAGNVIGGGDWGAERLVPDVIRAVHAQDSVVIRSPDAVRPWQHVLEPLSGYLWLGIQLVRNPSAFTGAWNFGPSGQSETVRNVVTHLVQVLKGKGVRELPVTATFYEAPTLRLDSRKAAERLGWMPVWDFAATIQYTADWYQRWLDGASSPELWHKTSDQITAFTADATRVGLPWTGGES